MTGKPPGDRGRVRRPHSVAERSHEIARECAMVEEVVARLRAEERRLLADAQALGAEREELEGELAAARDRVAAHEASLADAHSGLVAKGRELKAATDRLERQRELRQQAEREIDGYRSQIAVAQKRLGDLVVNVTRIQHKLLLRKSVSRRDGHG
jgi:chromosome segregation ATPase